MKIKFEIGAERYFLSKLAIHGSRKIVLIKIKVKTKSRQQHWPFIVVVVLGIVVVSEIEKFLETSS